MSRHFHVSLDIQGFLLHHSRMRDYAGMFHRDDGSLMPPAEAKAELLRQLSMGRKMLPYGECEGFSYETGCPGHPVTE
jgi:hypothetical protein